MYYVVISSTNLYFSSSILPSARENRLYPYQLLDRSQGYQILYCSIGWWPWQRQGHWLNLRPNFEKRGCSQCGSILWIQGLDWRSDIGRGSYCMAGHQWQLRDSRRLMPISRSGKPQLFHRVWKTHIWVCHTYTSRSSECRQEDTYSRVYK